MEALTMYFANDTARACPIVSKLHGRFNFTLTYEVIYNVNNPAVKAVAGRHGNGNPQTLSFLDVMPRLPVVTRRETSVDARAVIPSNI